MGSIALWGARGLEPASQMVRTFKSLVVDELYKDVLKTRSACPRAPRIYTFIHTVNTPYYGPT